jgi:hypothetical protein
VLKLVSLPIWHGLSPGRLQLELAAQPALAKRWKALLKKEAKAAKAAAAAAASAAAANGDGDGDGDGHPTVAEPPKADSTFLPGMLQEFLDCLRAMDQKLNGQQQQQPLAAAAAAAEEVEPDEEDDEQDEAEEQLAALAAAAADDDSGGTAAAGSAAVGGKRGAAAGGSSSSRKSRAEQRREAARLLLHLERFVEWLIDLLSQLPTRRFVHALIEDQQLLVKVRGHCQLLRLLLHPLPGLPMTGYYRQMTTHDVGGVLSPSSCQALTCRSAAGAASIRLTCDQCVAVSSEARYNCLCCFFSIICVMRPCCQCYCLCCLVVQARRSVLYSSPRGHLFQQLLDLLGFYCDFPLNDHTGEQLKDDDVVAGHYDKVCAMLYMTCPLMSR